jgi:hypothetical protein
MPAYYDLQKDFFPYTVEDGQSRISVAPFWVLAVVRFENQVTFDRNDSRNGNKTGNRSVTNDRSYIMKTKDTLILGGDVLQMSVSSSKASHVGSLDAILANTRDFRSEILPGDWVLAWIVNDKEKAVDLATRIRAGQPCNRFTDGFKFIGRAQTCDRLMNVDAQGHRVIRYSLNAAGFVEFDSQIIYFQQIEVENDDVFGAWSRKLGTIINDIVESRDENGHKDVGALKIDNLLRRLLVVLLGRGLPKKDKNLSADQDPLAERRAGGEACLVPYAVGALLGRSPSEGTMKYADLLQSIVGVQKYSLDNSGAIQNSFSALMPRLEGTGPYYRTGVPLKGSSLPTPPEFSYQSVWSILSQYLNPGLNEMYVTLRASPDDGSIVPTFIARQYPFTTEASFKGHKADFLRTRYLELPRWKIAPALIRSERIGTNDAQRFNLCHIVGIAPKADPAWEFLANKPIRDDLDIFRSGLRPYSTTVNCSIKDAVKDPQRWSDHVADFTMQQQLTLNGTVTLVGIEAPICIGDNCEFDDTVFHIESVTHSCSIVQGRRQFITSLGLTHGMSSEARIKQSKLDIALSQYVVFSDDSTEASVMQEI